MVDCIMPDGDIVDDSNLHYHRICHKRCILANVVSMVVFVYACHIYVNTKVCHIGFGLHSISTYT
jgi:hypothetical protein